MNPMIVNRCGRFWLECMRRHAPYTYEPSPPTPPDQPVCISLDQITFLGYWKSGSSVVLTCGTVLDILVPYEELLQLLSEEGED